MASANEAFRGFMFEFRPVLMDETKRDLNRFLKSKNLQEDVQFQWLGGDVYIRECCLTPEVRDKLEALGGCAVIRILKKEQTK